VLAELHDLAHHYLAIQNAQALDTIDLLTT
jgi:hypothetical protein